MNPLHKRLAIASVCGAVACLAVFQVTRCVRSKEKVDTTASPAITEEERKIALELATRQREIGNVSFQQNDFNNALCYYSSCMEILQALGSGDADAVSQHHTVRSNAVLCLYKLQQYQEACLLATEILESKTPSAPLPDTVRVKVLHRRGLASKALGQAAAAAMDFKAAIHFSPGRQNAEAERELKNLGM